jgi:hypothetical protein
MSVRFDWDSPRTLRTTLVLPRYRVDINAHLYQSQESAWSCICVLGISIFVSDWFFGLNFWTCSDRVVFVFNFTSTCKFIDILVLSDLLSLINTSRLLVWSIGFLKSFHCYTKYKWWPYNRWIEVFQIHSVWDKT